MVDRLERMTTETLDFARGSVKVARRTLNLLSFLDELAAGIEEELPGLLVVRDFAIPPATAASLDVDKLRRVASNIAANARDAMGGSGRLGLAACLLDPDEVYPAGAFLLTLEDEGPGVPPEIRESLFEPFVTRGKKGGTGLGLAVARRFVEDHGGKLDLLHEGPGARFRMTLPVAEEPLTGVRG
jgi:signal transduction histidine kinase